LTHAVPGCGIWCLPAHSMSADGRQISIQPAHPAEVRGRVLGREEVSSSAPSAAWRSLIDGQEEGHDDGVRPPPARGQRRAEKETWRGAARKKPDSEGSEAGSWRRERGEAGSCRSEGSEARA